MSHEVDVIVYGTICLDLLWRVAELPPPGGYVEIIEERKAIGGEAANTAIALSRWGLRTTLVGNSIGSDADGELLRELFAKDAPGLDLSYVQFGTESQTPYCVCMATPDGQRTMFGYRFADLTCRELDPQLAKSARYFTMEPNAYNSGVDACKVAFKEGVSVIPMDYARDPEINALSNVVLTSSEHVGRSLTEEDLFAFASQVRDDFGPTTIVTIGERGCIVAPELALGGDVYRYPAFVAPAVVDTTGSGDIFRAGLLYSFCKHQKLLDAIRFASAAAALNCGEMGGWTGIRSVAQINEFMNTAQHHA